MVTFPSTSDGGTSQSRFGMALIGSNGGGGKDCCSKDGRSMRMIQLTSNTGMLVLATANYRTCDARKSNQTQRPRLLAAFSYLEPQQLHFPNSVHKRLQLA